MTQEQILYFNRLIKSKQSDLTPLEQDDLIKLHDEFMKEPNINKLEIWQKMVTDLSKTFPEMNT